MENYLAYALLGTGFTFLMTAIGSAAVFFVGHSPKPSTTSSFFGFASGVMIAASVWSLLLPAQAQAVELGMSEWFSPSIGFIAGGVFLFITDKVLVRMKSSKLGTNAAPAKLKRTTMLCFAVTLHNLPEGMAVGLSFAAAAKSGSESAFAGAVALAIGIGLQNLPEGAAISLPLKTEGKSPLKSFFYGSMSGIVEPIGGLIGAALAIMIVFIMPFMLSFAAGAMIYVVVEDLVPEAHKSSNGGHAGTFGAMGGFVLMMMLDVALG